MQSYLFEAEGTVISVLPNVRFEVQLDNGSKVIGKPCQKMKRDYALISVNDRVKVQLVSPQSTLGCISQCMHHSV